MRAKFARDDLRRQDRIHAAGDDGASRHAAVLGALAVLGEGDATFALDAFSPTVPPEAVRERIRPIADYRGFRARHLHRSFRSSEMEDGTR